MITSTLTQIAQLATSYTSEFELTILAEELNGFGNAELIVEIEASHTATTQYRINKPVGKRWKEANPQLGTRYTAEIEHYAPANRYFMSIISEALTISSAEIPINTLEYITPYIGLPFTNTTKIACHIWDLNVEYPSMLIKAVDSDTVFRIAVPTNLISRKHEIHNHLLTVSINKINNRGYFKLQSINTVLDPLTIIMFKRYKPHIISDEISTTIESTDTLDEILPDTTIIKIGSKWIDIPHKFEISIEDKMPSPYGEIVWILDDIAKSTDTPRCLLVTEFLKLYKPLITPQSTKFEWDLDLIHSDGVLCKHINTNSIKLLPKHYNLEFYLPLTTLEAMNLVYADPDELPF